MSRLLRCDGAAATYHYPRQPVPPPTLHTFNDNGRIGNDCSQSNLTWRVAGREPSPMNLVNGHTQWWNRKIENTVCVLEVILAEDQASISTHTHTD